MMSIKRYKDGDFLPLNKYDFCRRTDAEPEYQEGSGAIFWLAVCAACWIIALCLAGHAGYFN